MATPQELLVAYNPDFTALDLQGNPEGTLEVEGGKYESVDPDGYFEDFQAHLERFAQDYPVLGGGVPPAHRVAIDWETLVIPMDDDSDEEQDVQGGDNRYPDLVTFSEFATYPVLGGVNLKEHIVPMGQIKGWTSYLVLKSKKSELERMQSERSERSKRSEQSEQSEEEKESERSEEEKESERSEEEEEEEKEKEKEPAGLKSYTVRKEDEDEYDMCDCGAD